MSPEVQDRLDGLRVEAPSYTLDECVKELNDYVNRDGVIRDNVALAESAAHHLLESGRNVALAVEVAVWLLNDERDIPGGLVKDLLSATYALQLARNIRARGKETG